MNALSTQLSLPLRQRCHVFGVIWVSRMRFVTNSFEYRIAQVRSELARARGQLSAADEKLARELKREIAQNEAVLHLLERTERFLRSIDEI